MRLLCPVLPSARQAASWTAACAGVPAMRLRAEASRRHPARHRAGAARLLQKIPVRLLNDPQRRRPRVARSANITSPLPFEDRSGRNSEQWRIRAAPTVTLNPSCCPSEASTSWISGAGNGWMSYRLAQRGHRPVAVDIFTDGLDGLARGAALRHEFPCVEAEFDRLPFADAQFDLAVFNSSLHYSTDYQRHAGRSAAMPAPGGPHRGAGLPAL